MSFLDLPFMFDSFVQLCRGIPLTLQLMALSVISGAVLATILATMRLSGNLVLDLIARGYIFVLRGTPLLVQLYIAGAFSGRFYANPIGARCWLWHSIQLPIAPKSYVAAFCRSRPDRSKRRALMA
jgi:octopine/nopaline transport system permease protein